MLEEMSGVELLGGSVGAHHVTVTASQPILAPLKPHQQRLRH